MKLELFKTRKETVQAVLLTVFVIGVVLLMGFFGADLRN